MFPLKQRDELVFGISTISTPSSSHDLFHSQTSSHRSRNSNIASHDLVNHTQIFNTTSTSSTTINFSTNTTSKRSLSKGVREIEMKRAIHRNIERQRRQDMSQLYASLRSLLPLNQIKGKRSLSDIMYESKNYIQNLQNNVQVLAVRRDNMKKLSISSGNETNSSNRKCNSPNYVKVSKNQHGIEILISNSSEFGMSRVMIELTSSDIKLNVVSCDSTKMNGRFLHKIHAEQASDVRLVDLSRLQERLTGVIN